MDLILIHGDTDLQYICTVYIYCGGGRPRQPLKSGNSQRKLIIPRSPSLTFCRPKLLQIRPPVYVQYCTVHPLPPMSAEPDPLVINGGGNRGGTGG
jgi:hypothetical protein